ncbi:hypothetical protein CC79DRAFT_1372561 [Sarocladium strictum]
MEARSLSSLNFLAANPPQYPVKPNEEKADSLCLYILRVPGTRDIFLSPFKPQVKSVTAEDIASSLYYVHFRDPAEEDHGSPTAEQNHDRSVTQPPSIARKPLPPSARPRTSHSPPKESQAPAVSTFGQNETPNPFQGPLSSHPTRLPPSEQPRDPSQPLGHDRAPIPARKPLGPRAMDNGPSTRLEPPQTTTGASDHANFPLTRPRTQSASAPRFSTDHANMPLPKLEPSLKSGAFSLDLIRRDRSSGDQWNVGRISCQGTEVRGFGDSSDMRRSPSPSKQAPRPAIDLSIENSGYAKFRNIPLPSVVEAGPAAIMSALAERDSGRSSGQSSNMSLPLQGDGLHTGTDQYNGTYFSRQVTMGYTKSWTTNVKEKLQKLETEARARTGHRRGDSTNSFDSAEQKDLATEPNAGMTPRGYLFTSPWNGRCEFRTGHGGRTLRLTHVLDIGGSNDSQSCDAEMVSELRFNLPTSEVLPGATQPRDSRLLENFGKALRSRARSDPYRYRNEFDDDERPSQLDLSLGKERAGGGRRGNRAKMGKLIITSEGLKMLDLVVAANIGVWWEAWEKNF